jgi:hypothetical protein
MFKPEFIALENIYLYIASVLILSLGQLFYIIIIFLFFLAKVSSKHKQLIYCGDKLAGNLSLVSDAEVAAR